MKPSTIININSGILALLLLIFSSQILAAEKFVVQEGKVSITPGFCFPECETQSAKLSGELNAVINDKAEKIYFPNSNLESEPDLDFTLPFDPDLDSGGTVRDVSFNFDEGVLEVKGIIDSRAFDGPLIEYYFSAKQIENEFNPRNFFSARPDFRKCVSPLCGGYFVKKVNRPVTRCADGRIRRECYVAELKLPAGTIKPNLGFGDSLLLQGRIKPKEFDNFGNLGEFVAKKAWSSRGERPRGRYVAIENNGILCITSPCFSFDQYILNRRYQKDISSYELEKSGASKKDIEIANKLLANGEALPAVGYNRRYKGFAGTGVKFIATQFFLPLGKRSIICEEGYSPVNGSCQTPAGCVYPALELSIFPGIPDAPIRTSCVKSCEMPAFPNGPGRCAIALP